MLKCEETAAAVLLLAAVSYHLSTQGRMDSGCEIPVMLHIKELHPMQQCMGGTAE